MMNTEAAATMSAETMTKGADKPLRKPAFPSPEPIDLDRIVFDPEYRARVRDALNRAGRTRAPEPGRKSRRGA